MSSRITNKITNLERQRVSDLEQYRGEIVTFDVETPKSEEPTQTPVLILSDITQTEGGHFLLRGVNLKRITDPDGDFEDQARRSYRVDRIIGDVKVIDRADFLPQEPDEKGGLGL
jgi:hypothetical protein